MALPPSKPVDGTGHQLAPGCEEERDGFAAVQMRGLPYRATAEDVRAFLGERFVSQLAPAAVGPEGQLTQPIHLVLNRDGRPSGFARIQFASSEVAHACRDELNLRSMDDRYVEVFLYTERPGKGRGERAGNRRNEDGVLAEATGTHRAGGVTGEGAALGMTRDLVVRECRAEMHDPKKRRILLSMLGVALSSGARAYLKQTDQGLKYFLAQHPNEFSVEGGKGCEYVTYTPVLQLSEALEGFTSEAMVGAAPDVTLELPSAMAFCGDVGGIGSDFNNNFGTAPFGGTGDCTGVADFGGGFCGAGSYEPSEYVAPPAQGTGLLGGETFLGGLAGLLPAELEARLLQSPGATRTPREVHSTGGSKGQGIRTPSNWGTPCPATTSRNEMPWGAGPGGAPGGMMLPPPWAMLPAPWAAGEQLQQPQQEQQNQEEQQEAQQPPSDAQPPSQAMMMQAAVQAMVGTGMPAPWAMAPQVFPGWPLGPAPFPVGNAWCPAEADCEASSAAAQAASAAFGGGGVMAPLQGVATAPAAGGGMTSAPPGSSGQEVTAQPTGAPAGAVRLRGLPFSAKEQDVLAFFAQHEIVDRISEGHQAVHLLLRSNGRFSGQAVVQMKNEGDVKVAQQVLGGQWMGSRYIEVFPHGEGDEPLLHNSSGQGDGGGARVGGQAQGVPAAPETQDTTNAAHKLGCSGGQGLPMGMLPPQVMLPSLHPGQLGGGNMPQWSAAPWTGGGARQDDPSHQWEALLQFIGSEAIAAAAGTPGFGAQQGVAQQDGGTGGAPTMPTDQGYTAAAI